MKINRNACETCLKVSMLPKKWCFMLALALAGVGQVQARNLTEIADDVLEWKTNNSPYVQITNGLVVTELGDITLKSSKEKSHFAQRIIFEIDALDRQSLSEKDDIFLAAIEHDMKVAVEAENYYWLGLLITPYLGGDIHNLAFWAMSVHEFSDKASTEAYLKLVQSYSNQLRQIAEKTEQQRLKGILLPKVAIPNARTVHTDFVASNGVRVRVDESRLTSVNKDVKKYFLGRLESLITKEIADGYSAILGIIGPIYYAAAPDAVGLSQYDQGEDFYEHLTYEYTGSRVSGKEIHQIGLDEIARIEFELTRLRKELGFKGSKAEFHKFLRTDSRWIAQSPADVEKRYSGFLDLIKPRVGELFSYEPVAPYGVKRLNSASESGQSFGYYQAPSKLEPTGYYRYNGSALNKRSMYKAQHLIYHELVPGHHLMTDEQSRLTANHKLTRYLSSSAYSEGWAEYAAVLPEELGLYKTYDLYGHLMTQSFTAARLVVDTGMNVLGWDLEQARNYMQEHTLEDNTLIETELLRYSTDIPAQALGYLMGRLAFQNARNRAESELAGLFDLRKFHQAILDTGPVPLNIVDQRVNRFIDTIREESTRHIAANNTAGILINQSAEVVWSVLMDRSKWMPQFNVKQVMSGVENQVGELAIVASKSEKGEVYRRLEETLFIQPQKRLVLRLAPMSNAQTDAIADIRINAKDTGVHMEFGVSWSENVLADSNLRAAELETSYSELTQKQLEEHLRRIKQAAENQD